MLESERLGHRVGPDDWTYLREAAEHHRGDVTAKVGGNDMTDEDLRRCYRLGMLACEGWLDQLAGSGPIIVWRLTTEGRNLFEPQATNGAAPDLSIEQ